MNRFLKEINNLIAPDYIIIFGQWLSYTTQRNIWNGMKINFLWSWLQPNVKVIKENRKNFSLATLPAASLPSKTVSTRTQNTTIKLLQFYERTFSISHSIGSINKMHSGCWSSWQMILDRFNKKIWAVSQSIRETGLKLKMKKCNIRGKRSKLEGSCLTPEKKRIYKQS